MPTQAEFQAYAAVRDLSWHFRPWDFLLTQSSLQAHPMHEPTEEERAAANAERQAEAKYLTDYVAEHGPDSLRL